jgi:hypothetical protein
MHLIPDEEADDHELRIGCPCLPGVQLAERPDGTWGLIVDHRETDVMKIKLRS